MLIPGVDLKTFFKSFQRPVLLSHFKITVTGHFIGLPGIEIFIRGLQKVRQGLFEAIIGKER